MLFASMTFLWIFLPVVIIVNAVLSMVKFENRENRILAKNIWLLIASLVFYAWGGIYYLLIMISSIAVNYVGGRIIGRIGAYDTLRRKRCLILVLVLDLGILFAFKYFNMVVMLLENLIAAIMGERGSFMNMLLMEGTGSLGIKEIVLPIGISFFTFQAMSYVIDVYTGKVKVQKSILQFALYVSFFPQLIAGPIVKYSDVAEQIEDRKETTGLFYSGQRRFCFGLAKKVLLANTFAVTADAVFGLEPSKMGSSVAWLGALAYTMQIYYDFSGYSDMAIGLGRMFGFRFKENFNYPYTAVSIQEFWRRWHISLSSWFKEYVYFPLGGSRCSKGRTCLNILIVFLLTGVWHGANFTFIVWGLFYALLQIIERLFLKKLLDSNPVKPINWLYTMLMVVIGWVLFRSDNIIYAGQFLKAMFVPTTGIHSVLEFMSMKLLIAFVAALVVMGFISRASAEVYKKIRTNEGVMLVDTAFTAVLLIASIISIVSGTYNPFIYFQF